MRATMKVFVKVTSVFCVLVLILGMSSYAAVDYGNAPELADKVTDTVIKNNTREPGTRMMDVADIFYNYLDIRKLPVDFYENKIRVSGEVEVDIQFETVQRAGNVSTGEITGGLSVVKAVDDHSKATVIATSESGYEFSHFRYWWIVNEDGYDLDYDWYADEPSIYDQFTSGAFALNFEVDNSTQRMEVQVALSEDYFDDLRNADVSTPPAIELIAEYEPELILYVEAVYTEVPPTLYTINVLVEGGGGSTASVNGETTVIVEQGAELLFNTTTANGYDFVGWDVTLPSTAESDGTYTARFNREPPNPTEYDLVITKTGNGSVVTGTFNNLSGTFNIGQIIPDSNWTLEGFFGEDGFDVDGPNASGNYSINMNGDKEVEVVFVEDIPQALPVDLTIVVTGEGNITSQVVNFLEAGETYNFGPLEGTNGYEFIGFEGPDADELVEVDGTTYSLEMNASKEIHIIFEKPQNIIDGVTPLAGPLPKTAGLPMAIPIISGIASIVGGFIIRKK